MSITRSKKLIIATGIAIVTSVVLPFSVSSCSTKTETQIMVDFYANQYQHRNKQINTADEYYQLWTDLTKANTPLHGFLAIDWCLEYSLYLPYLFENGIVLITNPDTTTIKLKDNDSLWNFYKSGHLQLQFLTRIANVQYKADNNTLLLAYTGYLRLKAITTITLQTTTNNTTSDSDYNFDKNNTIEILFSFGNCSFNKNNVNPSTGTWWTQVINPTLPFIGNEIGTISFYNPTQGRIAASNIASTPPITTVANYFGAYHDPNNN